MWATNACLESYADAQAQGAGVVHWRNFAEDADYRADIIEIVKHIGTKPGVYVLVSLWSDPSFTDLGWPTSETNAIWQSVATAFAEYPHVMFGIVNEPEENFSGALDEAVWQSMNSAVAAIRDVEDSLSAPHHIITVQGTGGWARRLTYYLDHPITAGGGDNIAYEVHVYDPTEDFDARFIGPSATLPVVIGEFGPAAGYMSPTDCDNMIDEAATRDIPHLAWTFHMRCAPNLLVDASDGGCGIDMPLTPTPWGTQLREWFNTPW